MSEKDSSKFIWFLSGLGIGIGLAILFAPTISSEEIRNNLNQRASNLADSARDLVEHGRERVRNTVSAIRGQAERFRESGEHGQAMAGPDTHGGGGGEP